MQRRWCNTCTTFKNKKQMASKSPKPKAAKPKTAKPGKAKGGKSSWGRYLKRLGITIVVLYVVVCAGMYFFQSSLVFRPTVVGADAKWDLTLKNAKPIEQSSEELDLTSELDGKVNALLFKAAAPAKGVVLFLHGNGGNLQTYLPRRTEFLKRGYDFCVLDYRGYGKSTGPVSEAGVDADAEAGWDYLAKQYDPKTIVIYGQSLGSGFAVRLAKKHQPRILYLEVPYTSLADVGAYQYPWLPVRWLTKYPGESLKHIGDVKCPVNIIHGTADEVIPYEMGEKLSKAAQKGQLYTCPDVGHNGCSQTVQYQQMLDQTLH
jgi:uncharacterized protein